VLGFLWTLLHPALIFTVLYLLFTKWMGRLVDGFAAYLLIGIVQYQFFEKSTSYALTSLRRKTLLVRNFKFPREILVFASVGSVFISYLLEMAVLLALLAFFGKGPAGGWLLLPSAVLLLLSFSTGVSLCLALLAVEYQDLERIWAVFVTAGFYLTPVFYPLSILSPERQAWVRLNPLTHLLGLFRACIVGYPSSGVLTAAAVLATGAALIAAGLFFFRRSDAWIADRVLAP
jgi:ABC-type polysaccharide/polyol phosphate export permease